ncbi:MAG: holin [Tissierellia bacterium]|nr:holin [Tissierellia bacterium]
MNNRWENYALWVSIIAFMPILAQGLGTYNIHLILPGNYGDLANAVLGILVLLGIINNPTESKGYLDTKK